MSKLLLPKKNAGADFPAITQESAEIQKLNQNHLEVLYNEGAVNSSGLPYLFAHPLMFSKRLAKCKPGELRPEGGEFTAYDIFRILIRGIFFGILQIEHLKEEELGIYGKVARAFLPDTLKQQRFALLKWRNKPVGSMYLECLVFPSVRATEQQLLEIQSETRRREMKFDPDISGGLFEQWFKSITTSYTIGEQVFPQDCPIPQNVLTALRALYNREYKTKQVFLAALKATLGEEQINEYQEQILAYAEKNESNSHAGMFWAKQLKVIVDEWRATPLKADYTDELIDVADIDVLDTDKEGTTILSKITFQRLQDHEVAASFIFRRKLENRDRIALEQFSALVKGIFLGVVTIKPDKEDYILIWDGRIIGGLDQESLVFPDDQFSADAIQQHIKDKEESIGLTLIRQLFKLWVDEITDRLPKGEKEKEQWPVWAQRLEADVWDDISSLSPDELIQDDLNDLVTVRLINERKAFVPKTLKCIKDYGEIFCDTVIRFKNSVMPDLPVKSEYLDRVDIAKTLEFQANRSERERTQGVFKIQLKYRETPIIHRPTIIDEKDEASILLWPSFKDPEWKIQYVLFHVSPGLVDRSPFIHLFTTLESGKIEKIGEERIQDLGRRQIEGSIDFVELYLHQEGATEAESVGVFMDKRQQEESPGSSTDIGLDFGTSNTCLSIKEPSSSETQEFHELLIEDKTFDLLGANFDKAEIHNSGIWFPTYGTEKPLKTVPSELLFDDIRKKTAQNLDKPIEVYSIPHPDYERREKDIYNYVVSDFKWYDTITRSADDTRTARAYLRLVLQMALATLHERPYFIKHINITLTYPLAFGKGKYDYYLKLLLGDQQQEGILSELSKATGITFSLRPSQSLIPESDAGKSIFLPSGYQLIVDIGGGTTDIALRKGDEVLAIDSIKYGGNKYAEFLAESGNLPVSLPQAGKKEETVIVLNKEIRKSGFEIGVIEKYKDPSKRNQVVRGLRRFYDGLFEYLAILLQSHNATQGVSFYPLGNGWEFASAIRDSDGLDNYIRDWFNAKGIQLNVVGQFQFGASRKGAVAIGALKIDFDHYKSPNLSDPIQAVIGCNGHISAGSVEEDILSHEPVPYTLEGMADEGLQPIISSANFFRRAMVSFTEEEFQEFTRKYPDAEKVLSPHLLKRHGMVCFYLDSISEEQKTALGDEVFNELSQQAKSFKDFGWKRKKEINEDTVIEEFNALCLKSLRYKHNGKRWQITRSLLSIFLEEIFPRYYLLNQ